MSKILNASIIVFVAAFAGLLIPTNNNIGTAEAQNGYYDEYEQEYYPEYDNSYYEEDQTGYGYYDKDYYPKPGKLTVKKELFQCFNPPTSGGGVVTQTPNACFEFEQNEQGQPTTSKVVPPTSNLYKNCSDPQVDCRYSTEDFVIDVINGEKITSNPEGVALKLSGNEYFVEEDDIRTDYAVERSCKNSGYDQGGVVGNGFPGVLQQTGVCIIYEGDCEGQLNPGDNKVCTVKNYLPVATQTLG
ncbi:MAG: hypothetical protein WCB31_12225 [Nitrososphaeraceae archaeon]